MKRVLLILVLCVTAQAQWTWKMAKKPQGAAAGGGTFSLVQFKSWDSAGAGTGGSTCTSGTANCTVTVSAVGAGHTLIGCGIWDSTGTAPTLSLNTETWAVGTSVNDTTAGGVSCRYVLSATGGETSFICSLSNTTFSFHGCAVWEFSYTGPSVSFDTVGTPLSGSCGTSCASVALTLTGTNDVIVHAAVPANSISAINGSYTGSFPSGAGYAYKLNTNSGTAPSWTQSGTGNVARVAISLKGN